MIGWLKALAKAHWPRLHLSAILFGTLLFVASLPGVAALSLRVYENTLVQQTESELIAQSVVLAAAYKAAWYDAAHAPQPDPSARPLAPEAPAIDLRTMPVLPRAPAGVRAGAADPRALQVAARLRPMVGDAVAVTLTGTRLLDAHGIVVLGRGDAGQSLAGLAEVRAALAGHSATVLRERSAAEMADWRAALSRAYAIRVHHARPVIADGKVIGVVMVTRSLLNGAAAPGAPGTAPGAAAVSGAVAVPGGWFDRAPGMPDGLVLVLPPVSLVCWLRIDEAAGGELGL